jgi:hypothetical protein
MPSFGTLGQILKVPPCAPKYSIVQGVGGVPDFFLYWNHFFELGTHEKFRNPTTTPSGNLLMVARRRVRLRRLITKNSGLPKLICWLHALRLDRLFPNLMISVSSQSIAGADLPEHNVDGGTIPADIYITPQKPEEKSNPINNFVPIEHNVEVRHQEKSYKYAHFAVDIQNMNTFVIVIKFWWSLCIIFKKSKLTFQKPERTTSVSLPTKFL